MLHIFKYYFMYFNYKKLLIPFNFNSLPLKIIKQ